MKRHNFADRRNEETRIEGTKETTLDAQGAARPTTTNLWGKEVVVKQDIMTAVGNVPKNTTGKIQKEVWNNAGERMLGYTVVLKGNPNPVFLKQSNIELARSVNHSQTENFSSRYNVTPKKLKDKKIIGDLIFSKNASQSVIDTICDEIYYNWLITGVTIDRVVYSTQGINDVKRMEQDRYEELTGQPYRGVHRELRGSSGATFYDPRFYPSAIYIYPGLIARFTSLNLVVSHEIAHVLNKKYNITNKLFVDRITKFILDKSKNANITPQQYIASQVSEYATNTYSELFSECYSQAINNINSELSDEVMRLAKMIPGFRFYDKEIKRYHRSLGTWAGNKLHLLWNRT